MLLTIVYGLVTLAAAAYAYFEARILWGYWTTGRGDAAVPSAPVRRADGVRPPHVTVQLPLFNEGAVAINLVRAVGAFDYPRDRLTIQVLDDSNDGTPALIAPEIERLRAQGLDIAHLRRETRTGWKAGALAWGLTLSTSEFVAIFDADFIPAPDYLARVLIDGDVFDDPKVAFLQGRWTYTNEHQNVLTRAQAILLNRHFVIQKPYQLVNHRTTMFNGSGGIWRRAAIDAVGGWSADTLCEDMDLSYRCALDGWVGVYEETLACPSEIPSSMLAFKLQQRRWAKGSAQCMRKLTGDIVRSDNLAHRWEDLYTVLGYVVHPILLIYSMLWPWVVLQGVSWPIVLAGQICLAVANIVAVSGFLLTTVDSDRKIDLRALRDVAFALVLGMALMVNNTIAFLVGCFERFSVFERTPKEGLNHPQAATALSVPRLHWGIKLELLFLIYMVWQGGVLIGAQHTMEALPCFMFGGCMIFIIAYQLMERFPSARARRARLTVAA